MKRIELAYGLVGAICFMALFALAVGFTTWWADPAEWRGLTRFAIAASCIWFGMLGFEIGTRLTEGENDGT